MDAVFHFIYAFMDMALPFEWLEPVFMKRALLEVLLVTPLCALMGIQVVNYRMAFFSDAISHSAFTGIAIGLLAHINPFLTMTAFGILVALGITKFKARSDLPMDTIIGVFFAFTIALGLAIISLEKGLSQILPAFLFGDVLTITEVEVVLSFTLFVFIIAFVALSYNRLALLGLNERLAFSQGVPTETLNFVFSTLLALVVTSGIRTVGILLITGLLIIPAACAHNISSNMRQMFWYSLGFAWLSGITGLFISFYTDITTGAAIILTASLFFLISLLAGRLKA